MGRFHSQRAGGAQSRRQKESQAGAMRQQEPTSHANHDLREPRDGKAGVVTAPAGVSRAPELQERSECGQETRGHVAGMSKARETAGTRGQQSLGVAGVERRQKPGAVGSGRRENPPPSRSLTQSRCLTKVSASHVLRPRGSTRGHHPDPREGWGAIGH